MNTNFTGEVGHPDRPTGPCMCLISAVARVSQITAGGQSFCILCFCSCDLALLRNRRPTHRDRFAHWRCAENNNQNEFATILRRAAETRASERRAAAERAKAAEAARNAAKAEAARARKAARKVAEAEAARAAKAAMDAKRAATAIAEMTTAAAATDGLGVRDSVADLRAAHERITRAATARARPARGATRRRWRLCPLSARLDAVLVSAEYRDAAEDKMQALPPPPSPSAAASTPPSAPLSAPLVSPSAEILSA